MKEKKIVGKADSEPGQSSWWREMERTRKESTMGLFRHRNILIEGLASCLHNDKARLSYLEQLKMIDDEIILRSLVKP